jgi:hypothetical protein
MTSRIQVYNDELHNKFAHYTESNQMRSEELNGLKHYILGLSQQSTYDSSPTTLDTKSSQWIQKLLHITRQKRFEATAVLSSVEEEYSQLQAQLKHQHHSFQAPHTGAN